MTDRKRIAAIHEAAHAVAHVLLARELGMDPEGSLRRIVLVSDGTGPVPAGHGFTDSDKLLTRQMQSVAASGNPKTVVDVLPAVSARVAEGLAGAVAEAHCSKQSVLAVLTQGTGTEDWAEIQRWLKFAQLSGDRADAFVAQAKLKAEMLVLSPGGWSAVLALAEALLVKNDISGREAIVIIDDAIAEG